MLDTNMLMLMGLMDHPLIIEAEKERLRDEGHRKIIHELVEKCMKNESVRNTLDFDKDLAELFIAAEVLEGTK